MRPSLGVLLLLVACKGESSPSSTATDRREPPTPEPVRTATPDRVPPPGPDATKAVDKEPESRGPCPEEMTLANDGEVSVCIDRYEFPGFGQMPVAKLSQAEAATRCESRSKRLCTEEEWRAACRGPEKTSFPYGEAYQKVTCNTSTGRPVNVTKAGAFPDCVSVSGVFDMAGNVAEWIATPGYTMGGSARDGDDGRCAFKEPRGKNHRAVDVGVRCCADPRIGR